MAELVLCDVGIWVEDARLGLYATQFSVNHNRFARDSTGFEDKARTWHKAAGDGTFNVAAYDDVVANEKALTLNLDTGTVTYTTILEDGANGSNALMVRGLLNSNDKTGTIDELATVSISGMLDWMPASATVFYSTGLANSDGPATATIAGTATVTLGALGAGDIGVHFPPSDVRWKDADSAVFLTHARDLVEGARGEGASDWVVPTFNTEPRLKKPILIYWMAS